MLMFVAVDVYTHTHTEKALPDIDKYAVQMGAGQ